MTEKWSRWEPITNLARKYYIDSVSEDRTGFKIVLSSSENENQKIKIVFKNSVEAYKKTDETLRHRIVCELSDNYGDEFYVNWTFFKVTNSNYLAWLSEQSYTISDTRHLTHFTILAVDSILDIVNVEEPQIEHISE